MQIGLNYNHASNSSYYDKTQKIMPNKKIQKIQTHKIKTQNKTMNKLK